MDKTKNKKKLWVDILSSLFLVLILFSGWIMFVIREIYSDTKETELINSNTKIISDSIKSEVRNKGLDILDNLIEENKALEDSLRYYSVFYRMVVERYDFEFSSTTTDSSGYKIESYELVDRGARRINIKSTDCKDSSKVEDGISDSISVTSET